MQTRKRWLLIKHKDEYAVRQSYDSEKETSKTSPINKWLAANNKPEKKNSTGQVKAEGKN